jgi:hypothetical protein
VGWAGDESGLLVSGQVPGRRWWAPGRWAGQRWPWAEAGAVDSGRQGCSGSGLRGGGYGYGSGLVTRLLWARAMEMKRDSS